MAIDINQVISDVTVPGASPLSSVPDTNTENSNSVYAYEQDVNRLARGITAGTVVEVKDTVRRTNINTALSAKTWSEPESPYGASYPHNQVMQTPNGLIQEFDDTPGNIRYHLYHPSGSYTEIDANGTEVRKIVGDNYYIIENNGNIFIGGKANVTVENSCNILILGDANLEVNGKLTALVKNDISLTAAGSMNLNVGENLNIKASNITMEAINYNLTTVGDQKIKSRKISYSVDQTYDMSVGVSFSLLSEDYNLSTNNLNIKSENNTNIVAENKFNLQSGGVSSIAGSEVRLGGSLIHLNSPVVRANIPILSGPQAPDSPQSPSLPSVVTPDFTNLIPPPVRSSSNNGDSSPTPRPNSRTQRAAIENDGNPSPSMYSLYPGYNTPAPYFSPHDSASLPNNIQPRPDIPIDPRFANITSPPYTELLSKYIRLKDVTINAQTRGHQIPVGGWQGLTLGQIVTNLQSLCVNVLDPIIEKYGDSVIILSGFRQDASSSQHTRGEAVDIRFKNLPTNEYHTRAAQLIQEIPFDQLIAEYQTGGSGLPWIHISYKANSNRRQFFTMRDHARVSPVTVV